MRKAWVQFLLGRVADRGTWNEVESALSDCDPLLRGTLRRKVGSLRERVQRETSLRDDASVARLAALRLAKVSIDASFDDRDGLNSEYQAKRPRAAVPPRPHRFTLSLAASLLVAVALGTGGYFQFRAFSPKRAALGELLSQRLTPVLVQLAARDPKRARNARAKLNWRGIPPETRARFDAVLDAAELIVSSPPGEPQRYYQSATELNSLLYAQGQPYFAAADTMDLGRGRFPTLLSYYVQDKGAYRWEAQEISVLRLWRLDTLNIRQSLLGYTQANAHHAFVLFDQLEEDLITQVLPATAPNSPMSMRDDDLGTEGDDWEKKLHEQGGQLLRDEFAAMPPETRADVAIVGPLLEKRRALLRSWKRQINTTITQIRTPRRLIPEANYFEDLHYRVPSRELLEWEDLHSELNRRDTVRAFERLREIYARSVERHEVQHRIDYAKERLSVPERVMVRLGLTDRLGHDIHSSAMATTTELSAYLAQIAESASPRLAFLTMARLLFVDGASGTAHFYASLIAVEEMARASGIDPEARFGRRITREELADVVLEIAAFPREKLVSSAKVAYEKQFEEPMPHAERKSFVSNPSWRH